ncbi:MAG: ABC transporter permease [Chitinispirillaceae bacterium]|nr:ABC transporter permease [Chitinispirillaceae bacterium]
MLLSLSWKNVWRNRARSLVVVVAIIVGLFGGVFSTAFMNGMSIGRIESAIANEIADIQVHNGAFLENPDISAIITGSDSITKHCASTPSVTAVSPRIIVMAMASTAATGTGVTLAGVDPRAESDVSGIPGRIVQGAYLGEKSRNPVIIGEKLAAKLKVTLRSKIVLTLQGFDSTMTGGAFKVVGIFRTDNSTFDETHVFCRATDLARLSLVPRDAAHEIVMRVKDSRTAAAVADTLARAFPSLSVRSWRTASPELAMLDGLMNYFMYLFLMIIMIALAFGIVNTMLMSILERWREIGMLMAVGMTAKRIFTMIILETVMLSMTGGIIGMALAAAAVRLFGVIGINLSIVAQGLAAIGWGAVIYPAISAPFFAGLSVMIIITAALSALYPARKALQINPAAAIRAE